MVRRVPITSSSPSNTPEPVVDEGVGVGLHFHPITTHVRQGGPSTSMIRTEPLVASSTSALPGVPHLSVVADGRREN